MIYGRGVAKEQGHCSPGRGSRSPLFVVEEILHKEPLSFPVPVAGPGRLEVVLLFSGTLLIVAFLFGAGLCPEGKGLPVLRAPEFPPAFCRTAPASIHCCGSVWSRQWAASPRSGREQRGDCPAAPGPALLEGISPAPDPGGGGTGISSVLHSLRNPRFGLTPSPSGPAQGRGTLLGKLPVFLALQ